MRTKHKTKSKPKKSKPARRPAPNPTGENPQSDSANGDKPLKGAKAIGAYLGMDERQVYHYADQLGIGRLGRLLIAKPSQLDRIGTKS